MKQSVICLCFLGLTSSIFAQDVIYSAKVTEKQVPEEVISAMEKDFKDYAVIDYSAIPITMVKDKVVVTADKNFDPSDYDSYQISLSGKNTTMNAYYDADGRLVSTYESMRNTELPSAVDRAIFKKYPKAKVESDKYIATYYSKDGKTTVHYHVKITNNGKKHHMYIDGNGNIVRG